MNDTVWIKKDMSLNEIPRLENLKKMLKANIDKEGPSNLLSLRSRPSEEMSE
jgi:hypothetical protein